MGLRTGPIQEGSQSGPRLDRKARAGKYPKAHGRFMANQACKPFSSVSGRAKLGSPRQGAVRPRGAYSRKTLICPTQACTENRPVVRQATPATGDDSDKLASRDTRTTGGCGSKDESIPDIRHLYVVVAVRRRDSAQGYRRPVLCRLIGFGLTFVC